MTVDEAGYVDKPKKERMGIRSALMASLDIARSSLSLFGANWAPVVRAKNLGTILRYAMSGGFPFEAPVQSMRILVPRRFCSSDVPMFVSERSDDDSNKDS